MKIEIGDSAQRWSNTARDYADNYLLPYEVEAELNSGVLPAEIVAKQKKRALELGFGRMDVPLAHDGLELPLVEQVAVWEQLGRVTNALSWCFPEAQHWMFDACSPQQIEQYVLPMMLGEKKDCYAITESGAGSDVAGIEATAIRDGDNYILNGEKWYVTSANFADFFWFQAQLPDENDDALFLVDYGTAGIEMIANPLFSHTYAAHHPTYLFKDVVVPVANRVGSGGDGMAYTKSWFRHERLMIGARSCGAAARLIEDAMEFAQGRIIGDLPLSERQAIQFMLADSATELWASRLMTYEAAAAVDRGEDLKALHNRCSMVKLYVSEMANRVADRAVQIFGGRGYMRENVAERFFRELRDHLDCGTTGIEMIANPLFSHTYAAHHPTYLFKDVVVPVANRVGSGGDGMAYTKSWFRHERLMIGARSCGAAARLIEDAMEFAQGRIIGDLPLSERQAIQFMLADSATELWASRLMTYEAAAAVDRGEDLKALHNRCSMVKLYVSEMANRVADRAVQIFGGRGYMRENVAERFFRELRVDRIWEGTSEIQRLIIARGLLKRGLDGL